MIQVSNSTKKPTFDVKVNGNLIEPIRRTPMEPLKEKVDYEYSQSAVDKIEIELKDKGPNDTVVVDGKIIEDVLLIIDHLSIDDINMTDHVSKFSSYKDTHGKICKTYNYITFNGTFTIKIHKNPMYTHWLCRFI